MESSEKVSRLEVETENTIYEIEFGQIQIEITGRCNMQCIHCRASTHNKDMPIEQILKVLKFGRTFSRDFKEVIISGGEPLLHKQFDDILKAIRENGCDFLTLTTNGSVLTEKHLSLIEELNFKRVVMSVSIDNLNPSEHDKFRVYEGAHSKAVEALRMIANSGIKNLTPSMRSTIQASQIVDMENMVSFAKSLGCMRVSFSAIHPAGKAIERSDLWMTSQQKLDFLKNVYRLKKVFPELNITTNDPLKCLLRGMHDIGNEDELVFDGCGAGAITFNVESDGTMTPCALLSIPMMNVFDMTIEEMTESYQNNEFVKNILEMNLSGKCGSCEIKYQCGGCRARSLIQNNDLYAEDPHCWK